MAYAEYTYQSESPESYHLFTGLSILASAVRKNIWLDQQIYQLYPNLFIILVGPPGKLAKSTCARLGRTLLRGVEGIKFSPDAVTSEELMKQIEKAHDGRQSAIVVHSSELSSLIDPSGIKMIQFLTDIYDGDVSWAYATKTQGGAGLKNPVVNLIGCTTPSWLANGMPVDAVQHGFTSRVIFVYEDKPRKLRPRPGLVDKELVKRLIDDLDHISRIEGEFVWDPGQGDQPSGLDEVGDPNPYGGWSPSYDKERKRTDPSYRAGAEWVYDYYYRLIYSTPPSDYRVEGYHWRKKNHLLKIAMLVAIAQSDELILTGRDIIAAWSILESNEKKMVRTFSAVGKYEHASDMERILRDIEDAGAAGMTREQIYEKNYAAGDEKELAQILTMLSKMGKIVRELDIKAGTSVYKAKGVQ